MAARGLWPTPTVKGNHNRAGLSAKSGDGLETAVQRWPTPTEMDAHRNGQPRAETKGRHALSLHHAVKLWPTPRAADAKTVGQSSSADGSPALSTTLGGRLNPKWVEWLMGVPARVHRLRGLGNAVVPQVAEWIGRRLMKVVQP